MSGWMWLRIGAMSGFLAVAAGAFGAHGLDGKIEPRRLANFDTAATYQMYHALALLAVGLLAASGRSGMAVTVAGWGFLVGTLIFSGSLYALALTGERRLGMITPFGGLAFLVGWAALAVAAKGAGPGSP
ncbi:MAG: DUF423 domain-containing protein [Isosphaeraceae bacterium]